MMAYPGQTLTTLGQLCTALWDSQSQLVIAWNRTRVCSDASSPEMQCLRPLRHSGALMVNVLLLKHKADDCCVMFPFIALYHTATLISTFKV